MELTHFDPQGNARMVDVGEKAPSRRTATAAARVLVNGDTFALIRAGGVKKGDVLTVLHRLEGKEPFDVIFMDPPFDQGLEKPVLTYLSGSRLLAEGGWIVVECSPKTDFSYLPELGLTCVKERVYGKSRHLFLERITED